MVQKEMDATGGNRLEERGHHVVALHVGLLMVFVAVLARLYSLHLLNQPPLHLAAFPLR